MNLRTHTALWATDSYYTNFPLVQIHIGDGGF